MRRRQTFGEAFNPAINDVANMLSNKILSDSENERKFNADFDANLKKESKDRLANADQERYYNELVKDPTRADLYNKLNPDTAARLNQYRKAQPKPKELPKTSVTDYIDSSTIPGLENLKGKGYVSQRTVTKQGGKVLGTKYLKYDLLDKEKGKRTKSNEEEGIFGGLTKTEKSFMKKNEDLIFEKDLALNTAKQFGSAKIYDDDLGGYRQMKADEITDDYEDRRRYGLEGAKMIIGKENLGAYKKGRDEFLITKAPIISERTVNDLNDQEFAGYINTVVDDLKDKYKSGEYDDATIKAYRHLMLLDAEFDIGDLIE